MTFTIVIQHRNNKMKQNPGCITGVRGTPSRSLTKPIDGPECRFIISAWISASDIFDKSEGRRSESAEGVDFLPHSFQASSSSSSTTSSRSSVTWMLRFAAASASRTGLRFWERRRKRSMVMYFAMGFGGFVWEIERGWGFTVLVLSIGFEREWKVKKILSCALAVHCRVKACVTWTF